MGGAFLISCGVEVRPLCGRCIPGLLYGFVVRPLCGVWEIGHYSLAFPVQVQPVTVTLVLHGYPPRHLPLQGHDQAWFARCQCSGTGGDRLMCIFSLTVVACICPRNTIWTLLGHLSIIKQARPPPPLLTAHIPLK